MQSLIIFGAINVIAVIFSFIPVISWFAWVFWVVGMIVWVVGMIKAYQGETFKFPWVGNIAEKWAQIR